MIESITTIRNHHGIKAKPLISICFTRIKWYYFVAIYTVMEYKGIKTTELCLVEITEKHYLQWFEGDCFRP